MTKKEQIIILKLLELLNEDQLKKINDIKIKDLDKSFKKLNILLGYVK